MHTYVYIHICSYSPLTCTDLRRVPHLARLSLHSKRRDLLSLDAYEPWARTAPCNLAFTRYCFMSSHLYTNQCYYLQTAPLFGHLSHSPSSPTLLRNIVYPPTRLYCNVWQIKLVIAISCKGRLVTSPFPPLRRCTVSALCSTLSSSRCSSRSRGA